uniref:Uncharacterized protein n=4 Tax=Oryza TaxID=4527 RepID=Q8SAX8_ORYSJ|nr:hypothetical protein [Oryza sativa Japonica Group]ABF99669.1 hypothetical protein LOC_Os03g61230 [Oryza sativa Japonica Group]
MKQCILESFSSCRSDRDYTKVLACHRWIQDEFLRKATHKWAFLSDMSPRKFVIFLAGRCSNQLKMKLQGWHAQMMASCHICSADASNFSCLN